MCAALAYGRKPTILLADDCQPMLKTVAGIVAPHFEVVAAVSDGQAVLDAAARTRPDVVLSDISMPRLDGIRATRELKKRDSHSKVAFLTAFDDDDFISEALSVGAKGYIFKRRMQSDLVPALNLILAGQSFISPNAFTDPSQFKEDAHVPRRRLAEAPSPSALPLRRLLGMLRALAKSREAVFAPRGNQPRLCSKKSNRSWF